MPREKKRVRYSKKQNVWDFNKAQQRAAPKHSHERDCTNLSHLGQLWLSSWICHLKETNRSLNEQRPPRQGEYISGKSLGACLWWHFAKGQFLFIKNLCGSWQLRKIEGNMRMCVVDWAVKLGGRNWLYLLGYKRSIAIKAALKDVIWTRNWPEGGGLGGNGLVKLSASQEVCLREIVGQDWRGTDSYRNKGKAWWWENTAWNQLYAHQWRELEAGYSSCALSLRGLEEYFLPWGKRSGWGPVWNYTPPGRTKSQRQHEVKEQTQNV